MADGKREKTCFTGVYQLVSGERRHDGKPDVCWYYTLKSVDGKKIWVKVGWRSEGYSAQYAAEARSKAVQTQRDGGTVGRRRETALTFAEAWAVFDAKWLSVAIKQPEDERGRYRCHLSAEFGSRRMDAITLMELEDYKGRLLSRGLAAATVRLILGDVRRVYRKLIMWEVYTGSDPTTHLVMPKADNARTRYLTQAEAGQLLAELQRRSPTWHGIALVSLHTGMRLSEVLHLEKQDIDLSASTLRIRDGKHGSRTAHMTAEVHALLSNILLSTPNALVFTGREGRQLTDSDTSNTFLNSVNACDLNPDGIDRRNKVSFHTLRHTFCSWLAMAGVPLYVIGQLVGHTTTEMTKRYAHLCPSAGKEATKIFESVSRVSSLVWHPDNREQPEDDTIL